MTQIFQAVGNRVAIDLEAMQLPIPREAALRILHDCGFVCRELRIIEDVRDHAHTVCYTQGARMGMAPMQADCSSLIKWAFGRAGIHIPRRSIQQRDCVGKRVHDTHVRPYDLMFRTRDRNNYFRTDPADGVGHVGLVTHRRTVLHLTRRGLLEESIADFMSYREFRGVTRIITHPLSTVVLSIPPHLEIESSDDVMWLILRKLPAVLQTAHSQTAG